MHRLGKHSLLPLIGIDSLWISLNVRSVQTRLDKGSIGSSQREVRACHSAPNVSQDSPTRPTSSRRCCIADGTPVSPGGLCKYVSSLGILGCGLGTYRLFPCTARFFIVLSVGTLSTAPTSSETTLFFY